MGKADRRGPLRRRDADMNGRHTATCLSCQLPFQAARSDARTCSTKCRVKASRANHKATAKGFRQDLIERALRHSSFILGRLGKGDKRALMIPRAHALAELNGFLGLPEPITDEELKAVMRANGWRDVG